MSYQCILNLTLELSGSLLDSVLGLSGGSGGLLVWTIFLVERINELILIVLQEIQAMQ